MKRLGISVAVIMFVVAGGYLLAGFVFGFYPWRYTVHRVEVKGLPGPLVEFVEDDSLGSPGGVIIVFPNGSWDKHPLPRDISAEELKREASAELDGTTLTVDVPRQGRTMIPGWRPKE